MKIGINTLFLVPGDVGGTETYLRETLIAIRDEFPGTELVLFTNNENDTLLRDIFSNRPGNVEFSCLQFCAARRPWRIIMEQTKLPLATVTTRMDILWSPGYTAPLWAACPQVVTIPDLQYKSYPEDMNRLERFMLDVLIRSACKRSKAVLAISDFARQEVIRFGFAPEDRVYTVLLGVDASFGKHASLKKRARIIDGLVPLDMPYILCVAHTYPHKNVHLLIEAFARIMDRVPHNLVLVGKPRRGEMQVQEKIKLLQTPNRLFRMDSGVSYQTLQMLYQGADIFALPSGYEGFGLPVAEAMMAGVPVVTSKEGSLPEVGGTHAFYMESLSVQDLTDKLLEVLQLSSEKRRVLTADAAQWAKKFTWKRSVQEMFSVFAKVLAGV